MYTFIECLFNIFWGFHETGKYWKIEKEILNKMFLFMEEELTYNTILKKNIRIYLSNVYLQFWGAFQKLENIGKLRKKF